MNKSYIFQAKIILSRKDFLIVCTQYLNEDKKHKVKTISYILLWDFEALYRPTTKHHIVSYSNIDKKEMKVIRKIHHIRWLQVANFEKKNL